MKMACLALNLLESRDKMKKTIKDFELKEKTVLIRCDFNVPLKDGVITDDNRIMQSLETIEYALSKGAKVVLFSHLGRVKEESDKLKNTLLPVAQRLGELLGMTVLFSPETRGKKLETMIKNMSFGQVLLVENTRFEDLDGKKESGNDEKLGKYFASLGDIFINDAFGTCHRAHASNVGIASHLPSGIGFLVEKELAAFKPALDNPKRPFTVILGGAKVQDKIGVIENLAKKADYILIGGGMAYTFLKAAGNEIGSSLFEADSFEFAKEMLAKYPNKLILPIDNVVTSNDKSRTCFITDIKANEKGMDIGPQTLKLFKNYLVDSKTVIWNGPVGVFEEEAYAGGTKGLCEILADLDAEVIIGGGDTASAVINFGYENKVDHVSTGGGASLELLEGKDLPGIAVIDEK